MCIHAISCVSLQFEMLLERKAHPVSDTYLEKLFTGGAAPVSAGAEEASETTPSTANICGAGTSIVSGAGTGAQNISGN